VVKNCRLASGIEQKVSLPFSKDGKFKKHILPWIPQFQIPSPIDDKIVISEKNVYCIISPSGMGKTAALARLLSKYPGLIITGSRSNEHDSGETTDSTMKAFESELMECRKYMIERYAYVRQYVQLVLISHLIHVLRCLDDCKKKPELLTPFSDNVLSYVGYVQTSGNTSQCRDIFGQIKEWCSVDITNLRMVTIRLMTQLTQHDMLKDCQKKIVVCIDEANLLEDYPEERFLSIHGDQRGVLAVFSSEIDLLTGTDFATTIYAGTNFSVDVSRVIQWAIGKSESKICTQIITGLDYLNAKDLTLFLEKHIRLWNEDIDELEKSRSLPIRRRQAAIIIEKISENAMSSAALKLSDIMNEAGEIMKEDIKANITKSILKSEQREEYTESLIQALFQYIVHYKHKEFLGDTFRVQNDRLATCLIASGFAPAITFNQSHSVYQFEARDYLSYDLACEMLSDLDRE